VLRADFLWIPAARKAGLKNVVFFQFSQPGCPQLCTVNLFIYHLKFRIMKKQINEAVNHLFDEKVQLTGVVEYGVSWADLSTGKIPPPPEGARFDLSFEGELYGETINGKIKGVDFLEVRADGRFMLNIQATILTDDGESIALYEEGLLTPQANGRPADLHLNMKFATHSDQYGWLNKTSVWGIGQADMSRGMVTVSAFGSQTAPVAILN
jgi:hypothetical protein